MRARLTLNWDPAAKIRDLPQAMGKAMEAAGRSWHTDVVPGHFEPGAAGRYNYQQRHRLYMIRKAKEKGHQKPLVWSGNMKAMVEGLVNFAVRGVNTVRCKVRMQGPRYLYQYRADLKQPDKSAEITRMTPAELDTVRRQVDENITAWMRQRTAPRVVEG